MHGKQTEKMFSNTVIAVFAGVFGSVLTLLASSYFGEFAPTDRQAALDVVDDHSNTPVLVENAEPRINDIAEELDVVHTELRQALSEASGERSQLANVLAQLSQKIDNLESEVAEQQALVEQDDVFLASGSQALPRADDSGAFGRDGTQGSSERTVQSLVAAGLDSQTAGDIQVRRDQYQLARLELFDQATREGWIESDDFNERLSELDEQRVDLRDELGESAYDQYLFESGRNNRVGIDSVINGSAAQLAGIQRGDIMFSYADARVFSTRELQAATRAGSRGEYVQVSFERSGQILSADLPRGPLGVTLRSARVAP